MMGRTIQQKKKKKLVQTKSIGKEDDLGTKIIHKKFRTKLKQTMYRKLFSEISLLKSFFI